MMYVLVASDPRAGGPRTLVLVFALLQASSGGLEPLLKHEHVTVGGIVAGRVEGTPGHGRLGQGTRRSNIHFGIKSRLGHGLPPSTTQRQLCILRCPAYHRPHRYGGHGEDVRQVSGCRGLEKVCLVLGRSRRSAHPLVRIHVCDLPEKYEALKAAYAGASC